MAPARPRLELLLPLLLLLLGPARGRPLFGPDWPSCRDASRRLNHLLWELGRPHPLVRAGGGRGRAGGRGAAPGLSPFLPPHPQMELQEQEPGQDPTPRIRCTDGCDPGALSTDSSVRVGGRPARGQGWGPLGPGIGGRPGGGGKQRDWGFPG